MFYSHFSNDPSPIRKYVQTRQLTKTLFLLGSFRMIIFIASKKTIDSRQDTINSCLLASVISTILAKTSGINQAVTIISNSNPDVRNILEYCKNTNFITTHTTKIEETIFK